MRQKGFVALLAGLCVAGALGVGAAGGHQSASATQLGSVSLPHSVKANGETLAAGTYEVRLTADTPQAVVGESANSERWVEFVQGGKVKGKEVATIISKDDIKLVAKGGRPSPGGVEVEELKGDDYLRVWINKGGTNYLIHFEIAAPKGKGGK